MLKSWLSCVLQICYNSVGSRRESHGCLHMFRKLLYVDMQRRAFTQNGHLMLCPTLLMLLIVENLTLGSI